MPESTLRHYAAAQFAEDAAEVEGDGSSGCGPHLYGAGLVLRAANRSGTQPRSSGRCPYIRNSFWKRRRTYPGDQQNKAHGQLVEAGRNRPGGRSGRRIERVCLSAQRDDSSDCALGRRRLRAALAQRASRLRRLHESRRCGFGALPRCPSPERGRRSAAHDSGGTHSSAALLPSRTGVPRVEAMAGGPRFLVRSDVPPVSRATAPYRPGYARRTRPEDTRL